MKAKLLKVLSSSTEPNTITIAILTTFMYSFNFWTKRAKDWIFNHIWVPLFTYLESGISALTLWLMVSLKWEAWTSICLESKSPRPINPPFNFLSTQNEDLIRSRWGRKLLANVSSHIQYYGCTMPKTTMISTLRNLWDNSEHKFQVASEHATLTILNMAIWSAKCVWT